MATFSASPLHLILKLLPISPHPLTYLIIIMLRSFNSLLVCPQTSNPAQLTVPSTSTIVPKPSMESLKPQPSSIQQHSNTTRNHKIKLQCMKELRHIFSCLRRDERNRSIQVAANIVQNILMLLNKQEQSEMEVKQEKSQEEIGMEEIIESLPNFQRIVDKPCKTEGALILILKSSTSSPTGIGNFFHLEMLSQESKIVQKSINFASLSQVKQEVQKIKKINSNICILVDDLRFPMQCESIKNQLSPLILTFCKLSKLIESSGQQHEEIIELLSHSHQHRIQRSTIQVVRKYISIRQFIEQRIKGEWGSNNTNIIAATAAYNIFASLPNIPENYIQQILAYFEKTIEKAIHQEWKKEVGRHNKAATNLYHYPSSLQNAQKCWKCEKKRVYTFCPTCASIQGRVFALCLSCYSKYETHELLRERKKSFFDVDRLRTWKQVDFQVEEMINEEIYDHFMQLGYDRYSN